MSEKGVIYLSRIPPNMGKNQLRKLFRQHGEIDRIYLTPEPAINRSLRKKSGGSGKKMYVEGWVEFLHKRDAKKVALLLNGQSTGGKKRHNQFREDIWTIRYLPKFTWEHLQHKIEMDKQQADSEVREEVTLARKTNRYFADQVTRARRKEYAIKKKREEAAQEYNEAAQEDHESAQDDTQNE